MKNQHQNIWFLHNLYNSSQQIKLVLIVTGTVTDVPQDDLCYFIVKFHYHQQILIYVWSDLELRKGYTVK
jgi:hypothetical protein